jgi:opacity protein-like surface antigen
LTALSASFALAQSDGYHKAEFFAGFSTLRADVGASGDPDVDAGLSNRYFNGFNSSVTGNINKYVGLKFDVSGHYKNFSFNVPGIGPQAQVKSSLYNVLGGMQIKNNSKSRRFKPFVHAMAGAGIVKAKLNDNFCQAAFGSACSGEFRDSETGFAAVVGGGVDVKLSKRVDLRLFQADYNPISKDGTSHNARFSFGIVVH